MDFFGQPDVPLAPPMDPAAFHAPQRSGAAAAASDAPAPASSPLISPPRNRSAALQLHEQDEEEEDEIDQQYQSHPPPHLSSYDPAPSALSVGGPCVASLASSYMLMEYAAELKGLSQMHVVRGVRAARKMPAELKALGAEIVQRVRTQVVAIVATLRAEIAELTNGSSKAKEGNLRRIRNAHGHLQAATELLNQAEVQTVTAAKKRRQSQMHAPRIEQQQQVPQAPPMIPAAPAIATEKANAVSNLAALCAAIPIPAAAASAPTRQSLSSASAAATNPAAAIQNAQAEIQKLMQQLETMKRLQSLMPAAAAAVAANINNGGSAAIAASGPAIPLAPSLGGSTPTSRGSMTPSSAARRKTIFIPKAPELTPDSFFFTGKHKTIESEEDPENLNQGENTTNTKVAAPMAPPINARSAVLGEITARANLKAAGSATNAANTTGGAPTRKRLSHRSQSVMEPSKPVATSAPQLNVFTRRIPGVESLSLADSIKVASKIKLRRTDVPRSPGGTPSRGGVGAMSGPQSSGLDVLKESLSAIRLRVQGAIPTQQPRGQQRSQSVMFAPPKFGAPSAAAAAKVAPAPETEEVDQENVQSWGTN